MPRETQRLDLYDASSQPEELERLVKALKHKRKIVVIAGAGISVSAGSEYIQILLNACTYQGASGLSVVEHCCANYQLQSRISVLLLVYSIPSNRNMI